MTTRLLFQAALLSALLALVACSGSGSSPSDAGGTTDAGQDAGPTGDAGYDPTCSQPGTPGNENGVGKFCRPGGSECNTNPIAIFCTATFDHSTNLWFCTQSCQCDSSCGTGAICTGGNPDGGGEKGCVPVVCAGGESGSPICPLPDGGFPPADGG